jgi:hypothetical protein
MGWRKYKECQTCKNNKTSGWDLVLEKKVDVYFLKN